MNSFARLLACAPLWSALAAWFVCQSCKGIITGIRTRKWDLRNFLSSGGMPSSHTGAVVGLSYMVAVKEGLDSSVFAVCVVFSLIVMYDAVGVRRETGKQSRIINLITNMITGQNEETDSEKLNEIVGHSPSEVFAGLGVGILVGFLFSLIPVP